MSLRLVNSYSTFDRNESANCSDLTFCLSYEDCWDFEISDQGKSRTGQCWRIVLSLISLGSILVFIAEFQGRKKQFRKFNRIVLRVREVIEDTIDDITVSMGSLRKPQQRGQRTGGGGGGGQQQQHPPHLSGHAGHGHQESGLFGQSNHGGTQADWEFEEDDDVKTPTEPSELAFVTTLRTEANFIKNNNDPTMVFPNMYPAEYTPRSVENTVLPVSGFFADMWHLAVGCNLLVSVYLGSAGWAMICSGFSSLLWIVVDYERECIDQHYIEDWITSVGNSLTRVREDYDFYPVFLLIGYIGYVVQRWREFMVNCHECQAKIHDVALLCGGSLTRPPSREVRKKLYRIYRYLNVIHALCYKSVSPTLGPLDIEMDFVRSLRLLEVDESDELMNMGNKKRDAVIGWLAGEIADFLNMEGVNAPFVENRVGRALAGVRALVTRHHDLFVRDNPNLYLDLMLLVVNALLFLVIISYPFSLVVYAHREMMIMPCFQPIVMIGVFVVVASFRTSFSLLSRLRNPFSWTRDRIKIDSLLASTDRATFILLHSNFRPQSRDTNDPRRRWMQNRLLEQKVLQRRMNLVHTPADIDDCIEAF